MYLEPLNNIQESQYDDIKKEVTLEEQLEVLSEVKKKYSTQAFRYRLYSHQEGEPDNTSDILQICEPLFANR